MKALLTSFLLVIFIFNFAAAGDTTFVQAHNQTHWTWYGNYDVNVSFPNTSTTYEKVLMEFTIGCPETGCSEWDYFSKISARLKTGAQDTNHIYDSNGVLSIDTFDLFYEVELGRVITPYAGNYDNDWERKYLFDVSDFQSILKDSVIIRAFYDGWQDGWIVSTKFLFIEGTPTRNVLGFENLWTGRYTYGETDNPIADQVIPKIIDLPTNAVQSKLRVVTTGHRFGGAENCAEFCIKTHEFHVNGSKAHEQYLWRTDCGMNPEYPQAGTWLYDRAGWCPGAPVDAYEYDMTSYLTGSTMELDYQFDDYVYDNVNPPAPSYYIGSALVYYGAPNFVNDVELLDIISPNITHEHRRFNPICGDPVIVIRNNGSDTLKQATIDYGLEGLTSVRYKWEGSLAYLEADTVVLSTYVDRSHLWKGAEENGVFFATVIKANGVDVEYPQNSTKQSKISLPPVHPNTFLLRFKTNAAAMETTYKLYDQNGVVVYSSPDSMEARATYDTIVNLSTGCYTIALLDAGKDGADFWANNDGRGKLEFRTDDYGLADIEDFDLDFGTAIYYQFRVGYSLSIEEQLEDAFYIGPNPNEGLINIRSLAHQFGEEYSIKVYSHIGQMIYQASNLDTGSYLNIDLQNIASQVVFVEVIIGGDKFVKKIIVQ